VNPLFFPGGNIGKLAVCGTVNDLSVSGATPLFLSASFIIEEGFPLSGLETIIKTMQEECQSAGVSIVTGDTKVVEKGKCDGIFINTSGIGILNAKSLNISEGTYIEPGDKIIINGNIGNHAAAVLCARNAIEYYSEIKSDCASLNGLIENVLHASGGIRFMRDATRGGLAGVLCELAEKKLTGIEIYEENIPVTEAVKGFCEIFGYEAIHLANEGKVVMVVDNADTDIVLKIMRSHNLGKNSRIIGNVTHDHPGSVIMHTSVGGKRTVEMLAGEMLPRIC
jgi:hydrogenase expression/formation protein HypE